MSESEGETPAVGGVVLARLAESRWLLIVSAAAIGALGLVGDVPPLWQALAFGGIAAVAALVPRQTALRRKREAAAAAVVGLDGHPARDLAEAVPDPLIVFDLHGMITNANAAARAAFGKLDAGTLLMLRFRTPELQGLVARLLAGADGGALSCDYVERVPIERWFRVSGAALGQGSGLFVLVFKDQSEMRRIDRMRSDFIANASHELRTPLASIAGFVETLRGPARNDARAREQFLQIMQTQTGRMARLIDDLLSLSRLEMKSFSAPAEPVDLKALIDGVVDALRHLAAENGVEIEKVYPADPVALRGMRDELIQVFENLLENAIKYGQDGKRVVVTVEKGQGAGPRVTVRDFGPGIPEEHIPRLTERFYRVDVDTSRTQKGTGLGLAIVKHILTRHDARLTIRSTLGEGAAFFVQFPGK